MKYNHFFRNNLTNIAICLAVLFLVYYLFSNYRFAYKTPFGYVEHLTDNPNCKTFNCSSVHGPSGTIYKPCVSGDPTCKDGQRCSACVSSSTNPSCTGGDGNCTPVGGDPYYQPATKTKNYLKCCPGSEQKLGTWDNTGRYYYKCVSTCTPDGKDSWESGKHMTCCPGTKEFLKVWKKGDTARFRCCKPAGSGPGPDPGFTCKTDVDCADHGQCGSGDCICQSGKCIPKPTNCPTVPCPSGQTCQNGTCIPSGGGGSCPTVPCPSGQTCQNGTCIPSGGGGSSPDIQSQPGSTIQIVNNTSEEPLHVFLGTKNDKWTMTNPGGNGAIYEAVRWGSSQDLIAWDPIGAGNISEAIIPKNGYIILNLPKDMHGSAFRVTPLKLKNNDYYPLKLSAVARSKVMKQWPILLEGGEDVVADSSAVDGINFRMKYELTGKSGVETMEIHKNPCAGLDPKYQLEVGCRNPALIDCSSPTCDCKPNSQNCKFNDCSEKLFNIPPGLQIYKTTYDGGKPANNEVVKPFINKTTNLKDGSPLRRYCNDIQENSGDFTAYCYDYNDVGSSPWLSPPYKMKVTYMDL